MCDNNEYSTLTACPDPKPDKTAFESTFGINVASLIGFNVASNLRRVSVFSKAMSTSS